MKDILAYVMAGGKGERLMPLTRDRAKPAVPFGAIYRLIDFTLSNCINSQVYKIVVLPQYKFQSLNEHLELCKQVYERMKRENSWPWVVKPDSTEPEDLVESDGNPEPS